MSGYDETYGQGEEAVVVKENAATRARRRSVTISTWFVVFLIMGFLGSALLGYVG